MNKISTILFNMSTSEFSLSRLIEEDLPSNFHLLSASNRQLRLYEAIEKDKNISLIKFMLSKMQDIPNIITKPASKSCNSFELALLKNNQDIFHLLLLNLLHSDAKGIASSCKVITLGYLADTLYNNTRCSDAVREHYPDFSINQTTYDLVVNEMLIQAVKYDYHELAEKLLTLGADVNVMIPPPVFYLEPKSLLVQAIGNRCTPMVQVLLQHHVSLEAQDQGYTPLHEACHFPEIVSVLLTAGLDPNAKNLRGETALHLLVVANGTSLAYFDAIKQLVAVTDINAHNIHGETPLYLAVASGNIETVNLLITLGADINVANEQGITPLFLAASSPKQGMDEKIALLLTHNANVDILPDDLTLRERLEILLSRQLCEQDWKKQNINRVTVLLGWFVKHNIASEFLDTPRYGLSPRNYAKQVRNPAIMALLNQIPPAHAPSHLTSINTCRQTLFSSPKDMTNDTKVIAPSESKASCSELQISDVKPQKFNDDFTFVFLIDLIRKAGVSDKKLVQLLADIYGGKSASIPEERLISIALAYAPENILSSLPKQLDEILLKIPSKSGTLLSNEEFSETEENILADIGELEIRYEASSRTRPNLGMDLGDVFRVDEASRIQELIISLKEQHTLSTDYEGQALKVPL